VSIRPRAPRTGSPSPSRQLSRYRDPSRGRAGGTSRGRRAGGRGGLLCPTAWPGELPGRAACSPCAPRSCTRRRSRSARGRRASRRGTRPRTDRSAPRVGSRPALARAAEDAVEELDGTTAPCHFSARRCSSIADLRRGPGPRTWAFAFLRLALSLATPPSAPATLLGPGRHRQIESDLDCRLQSRSQGGATGRRRRPGTHPNSRRFHR